MNTGAVVLKDKALKTLMKAFKSIPSARVGVLGSRGRNDGMGTTNAQVLAAAEYGTEHSPIRSVLRIPITDNMQSYLARAGAFDKQMLAEVIKTGTIRPWVAKLGITGESIVSDGFDSQGFGKWPDDKPATMRRKKIKQVLVETVQMRRAITSDVVD